MNEARRPPIPLWLLMVVIVAVTGLGPLALNIFVPSIPKLQAVYAADFETVALTLSLYLIGMGVGQLVYGPLSDRFGRRSTLLGGIVLFVVAGTACLFAPTIESLILGRFAQAFGGCAGMVIGRAMIRDLFDRARSAEMLSLATMAMVVIPMIAPTIGGLLDHRFGWQSTFAFVVVFGVVIGLAAFRWLPETRKEGCGTARLSLEGFRLLLRQPAFHGYCFQVGFTTAVFFCVLAGAPYVVIEIMGRTSDVYGFYFVMVAGGYMIGNFVNSRLARRVPIDRTIAVGTMLSLSAVVVLIGLQMAGLVTTPLILFIPYGIVAFGNGLSVQNGIAGAISVEPRLAGTASGISGFVQMMIGAGASYTVGLVMRDSALPMMLIMIVCSVLAVAAHQLAAQARPSASSAS